MEYINKLKKFESNNDMQNSIVNELLDNYKDNSNDLVSHMNDVLNHGCISGIWLISYKETNEWYDKFENDIEDLLSEYQEETGFENRFETIASLNGADNVSSIMQEKNLLCWYAYEETIRYLLVNVLKVEDY